MEVHIVNHFIAFKINIPAHNKEKIDHNQFIIYNLTFKFININLNDHQIKEKIKEMKIKGDEKMMAHIVEKAQVQVPEEGTS